MAIELCSDSSGVSPRISFSHDLCLPGITPLEASCHTRRSSSNSNSLGSPDFDFCVGKSLDRESSAADDLFSDGKIVPSDQIKKRTTTTTTTQENDGSSSSPTLSQEQSSSSSSLKEIEAAEDKQSSNNSSSKSSSFWRFKRSSSGGSGSNGRSLCPLPLLSRSYSTGSSYASSPVKRGNTHPKHLKQQFSSKSSSSQSSSSNSCQKPPLKKNYGNYNVNPVLNVPSGNLFGLGSLFSSSSPKDKNKKK